MFKITDEALKLHQDWLNGINSGVRLSAPYGSNLSYSNLSDSNLSDSNLRGSDLSDSNLSCSNLSYSNLSCSNLSYSNLSYSNLRGSNLSDSNLSCSNLSCSNLRGSNLSDSNLSDSNLRGSNLSYSNLRGSNLRGSNLWGTTGNGQEIITLQCGKYWANYTHDRLQIGCKNYAIAEWWGFSDDVINSMDNGALEWWKIWKPILMQIITINPATPTGHEGV